MSTVSESLESPLVRVPFEALRRTTRERKYVLEEVEDTLQRLRQVDIQSATAEDQASNLSGLADLLQAQRTRLNSINAQEQDELRRCKIRLAHVEHLGMPSKDAVLDHCRQRMPLLLIDHLMRSGQYLTAHQFAVQAGILDLTDLHLFEGAQAVVEALQQHDCKPALAWCHANQSRLRRLRSKLEFKLCLQEFIGLVRDGSLQQAIAYARANLAPWATSYLPELQQGLCTLVFRANTTCQPYQQLFADTQWLMLAEAFLSELYRLHSLPPESQLSVHIQAGLSALKPAASRPAATCIEDPLHAQAYQHLAEGLPSSKQIHSKLICPITRALMNEHNPPVVVPNGAVYSEKAVQELSMGGCFTCPKSGYTCDVQDVQRAFIS